MHKRIFSILLISLFLLIANSSVIAEDFARWQYSKNNFQVIDSMVSRGIDEIETTLGRQNISSLLLKINDCQANEYMEQKIISSFDSIAVRTYSEDSNATQLKVFVNNISTQYKLLNSTSDFLERIIEVDYTAILIQDGNAMPMITVHEVFSDRVPYDNAAELNSKDFAFATGKVPLPETTFFEEFTEPLIVVGAAIIVAVLLFTVRSN
jgi:hypothetical protein